MMKNLNTTRMKALLVDLYGEKAGAHGFEKILPAIEATRQRVQEKFNPDPLSAKDVVLITYADQFKQDDQPPLEVLREVCLRVFDAWGTTIHILPFFPYTSDDGFSVSDYRTIKPEFGNWEHIDRLGRHYRLMFDAVVNHTSVKHQWFERFLGDDPDYSDFYVTARPEDDLREVVRPRALPLLTPFRARQGKRFVWTTFSEDQVDLNYANPAVLIEISKVLLEYAERGAQFIRLDAIAYLWKEIGTRCIHLPQTHKVIQFWRAMFEEAAPYIRLITETNVPHEDNVSYFGDGSNEAHLVYNFALPPLVLHAMRKQNAAYLTQWASGLHLPSREAMFFNFLASHDGIGLNPARGILPESEIEWLVGDVQKMGGLIGYKSNPDGSQTPYELNINYLDALADYTGQQEQDVLVSRFLTAYAVLLSLAGLPAIYVHSLLGSRGWIEGVARTGMNRSINREK
ncbi:MAG: alpha-amylase family glycosyl hydrolase, partial [Chloroflexota bacterium]